MKSLYLECETGISGDMIVAALLDLGADEEVLRNVLKEIPDDGFKIEISRVMKAGIDCCDFNVVLDHEHENHDHDMEYLYGHMDEHHDHHHDHDHEEHHHEHDHHHDHEEHHHHHHSHRSYNDVVNIIDGLPLSDGASALAKRVFRILAEAESKAHNRPIEGVHFHEVGAIDSIVDIVAAAVCYDNLGISKTYIRSISEGSGSVRCQHGILPVPVPAVMNIAASYALPIRITDRQGELITPTGAAFAAAVMSDKVLPEVVIPVKTGMGAGKREYKRPSILRAVIFEEDNLIQENKNVVSDQADCIWKLECNIDDSTGEQLGYVMELLMKKGARDVYYTPVYMKKNRPAWLLSVITDQDKISDMEHIIFEHTTTIGIRRCRMERTILPRREASVATSYGEVQLKICEFDGREKVCPEYESVREIADRTGIPIGTIYQEAISDYIHKK